MAEVPFDRDTAIRWLPCRNASSTDTIPPRSLVRAVSVDGDQVLEVDQPDEDDQECYVTSGEPIPPEGIGQCTRDDPITVAYDDSDVPVEGDEWGAEAGSYEAVKDRAGWVVEGDIDTAADGSKTFYARRNVTVETQTYVIESGNAAPRLTDNANFSVVTRGSSLAIPSGGFSADRWYVETETDGVNFSREDNPFSRARYSGKFEKSGSSGQFLIVQWLRMDPHVFYRDRHIHVQMSWRASKSIQIRTGFFLWTGTENNPTTPFVSVWATGSLPTWAAGILSSTFTATVTTSWGGQGVQSPPSGFSFDNLGFVMWPDEQLDPGDWLEITEAFLGPGGNIVTAYPTRWELDELACTQHGILGGVFN